MGGCIKNDIATGVSESLNMLCSLMDGDSKRGLAEIKAYAKPPDLVMKTMCAVMTAMEKTPSWAQAKMELQTDFLLKIKNFDRDRIPKTVLRKLTKYLDDPTFSS